MEQSKDNCKMKSLSYYDIFSLRLLLVESNMCDVNKKENNIIIQKSTD